jgi:hypothetical protein
MSQVNEIKMSVPVTLAAIPVQFDNIQRIGALAGTSLREITGGTYKIALLLLEKNNQLPAANEVFDYLRGPTAGTATWIAQSPAGFLRMALGGREENAKEMSDALGWIQGRNYGAEVTGVLHIEAFY